MRLAMRQPVLPFSRVIAIRAGKSGARRRVIRAILLIVNFIVMVVSIFQWSIWRKSRGARENSPAGHTIESVGAIKRKNRMIERRQKKRERRTACIFWNSDNRSVAKSTDQASI